MDESKDSEDHAIHHDPSSKIHISTLRAVSKLKSKVEKKKDVEDYDLNIDEATGDIAVLINSIRKLILKEHLL